MRGKEIERRGMTRRMTEPTKRRMKKLGYTLNVVLKLVSILHGMSEPHLFYELLV